jgi:phosphonate transport system substrate-binding protein
MKKFLALLLAVLMIVGCTSAMAEAVKLDKLTLEFVPSKDADVIITGTKNLPQLLSAALLEQGYDVAADKIAITVGTSYEATGEAMAAGTIDIGWLPGGTYALYSDEVDVILTATRAGLSNDSTDPKTWNGDANKTLPTEEQVTFYRSLIYATPSAYGKELAAKVNAGEALTWDDLSKANWAVLKTSSSAGYIYPTMWLMANYDGKKLSDLPTAVTLSGYGEAFAQAAAESVDIIVCYADGRRDYEEAWKLPADQKDSTGKAGMGRTESIWNELNVIGVTDGIYNDTVSITKANPAVYNPEFIAAIQKALINVIGTDEGKAIFSVYSHTGYAIATDADYDGARQALKAVQ